MNSARPQNKLWRRLADSFSVGLHACTSIYFPLSESWRKKRKWWHDWSTRVLAYWANPANDEAQNTRELEVAPWPGFGPGSSGRQPLILFRQWEIISLRPDYTTRATLYRVEIH